MGGDTLQPVMQPAEIHGSRGHDMLKMGARLSNVTRAAQPHSTNPPLHGLLLYLLAWHILA